MNIKRDLRVLYNVIQSGSLQDEGHNKGGKLSMAWRLVNNELRCIWTDAFIV